MARDQPSAPAALQGRRILVVEDEMLIALELRTILEQQGCIVLGPVPTVARALALLERERPDAAVLDLNLRGEPATPVARALIARGVPFVILSGYARQAGNHPELRDAPRMDKPVDQGQLSQQLAGVLTR